MRAVTDFGRPLPVAPRVRREFTLGRILGFPVGIDRSWILIFALIGFSLYIELSREYPDFSAGAHWIAAGLATALFFGCILLHELAHSAVARATGLQVRGITLFFFGGISRLTEEPRRPRDEFLMALAGPAASLVLGGVFFGLQRLFPDDSVFAGLTGWLGFINISLAVFNLLPGFPLDGGRVFRAAVWGLTHDRMRATRIASRVGAVLAWAMICWGLVEAVLFNRLMSGLWVGFLGWFLLTSAEQSVADLELRRVLRRIRAGEALRADCTRVSPDESVEDFVQQRVLRSGEHCFFVSDQEGQFLGLVTLQDVKAVPRAEWSRTTIRRVMVPLSRLRCARPDQTLLEVLEMMAESDLHQVPVLDGTSLQGFVARDEILRRVRAFLELEARA